MDHTDQDRRDFLDALDALDKAEVAITDWEANFLETNYNRQTFTPGQRESIDRMILKYGDDLKDW